MKINISSLLTNPPFENLRVGILGENFYCHECTNFLKI